MDVVEVVEVVVESTLVVDDEVIVVDVVIVMKLAVSEPGPVAVSVDDAEIVFPTARFAVAIHMLNLYPEGGNAEIG